MTNEELVILIRRGQQGYMQDLYTQNRGMIYRMAARYAAMKRSAAVDIEDFMQTGYIALAAAVDGYDEEQSAFISYLVICLRSFMRRLVGLDGVRKPHFMAASLDEEIPGSDGDATRGDLIPDEAAADPCEAAELSDMQQIIRAAVDRLPDGQRDAIQDHYLYCTAAAETAETAASCDVARRERSRGMSRLRRDTKLRDLWELYERPIYRHVTFSEFSATWSSTVEKAVIKRERLMTQIDEIRPRPY